MAKQAKCNKYSVLKDHGNNHTMRRSLDLMTKAEFCALYCHVPEDYRIRTNLYCLDKECIITKELAGKYKQPKYVVATVALYEGDKLTYLATYSNCYEEGKHAEDFFDEDARKGELKSKMDERRLQNTKIVMYITLQPCHESADPKPNLKSCCNTLVTLYTEVLKPVHLIIKPTFLYKVHWENSSDLKTKRQIKNGKEGMTNLILAGIELQAMQEDDWNFLIGRLCPYQDVFKGLRDSESRHRLDKFIDEFIVDLISTIDLPEEFSKISIGSSPKTKFKASATSVMPSASMASIDREMTVKVPLSAEFNNEKWCLKWSGSKEDLGRFLKDEIGIDLEGKWSSEAHGSKPFTIKTKEPVPKTVRLFTNDTLQIQGTKSEDLKNKLVEFANRVTGATAK